MAQSQKSGASFFNNPLTRTKVRSANVKPVEALIGYLYLSGEYGRLTELVQIGLESMDRSETGQSGKKEG